MAFELLLTEDNATALKYICAIIHNQNQRVPKIVDAHNVPELAIAFDKYDFVDALTF